MIDASPLTLLLLLAALVAVPLLLRRRQAHTPDGLRVVARTALSKQAVLAVVAVGDRRLLVGAGDQGIRLLAEVTSGAEPQAHADDPGDEETDATDALTTIMLDRTDAGGPTTGPHDAALGAAIAAEPGLHTPHGPGNGLVDRLRARTVRTPTPGRPFHELLHR